MRQSVFKVGVLFSCVLICSCLVAGPETQKAAAPQPLLKSEDIDHFCKSYPTMHADLEKVGMKLGAGSEQIRATEGMMASKEVSDILKKNGFDEAFGAKMTVIFQGYGCLMIDEGIRQMEEQQKAALEQMKGNPNAPKDIEASLKAQLEATTKSLKDTQATLKAQIHASDLAVIERRKADIIKVMETASGQKTDTP